MDDGIIISAGVVLAAGASSRMGTPKPLLRLPDGHWLGETQVNLLREAGCAPVKLILGAEADAVSRAMPAVETALNERWRHGRISSVQAGLRAVRPFAGCVLLPVDTVGVQADTIQQILRAAGEPGVRSVRPFCQGSRGLLCWISGDLCDSILALDDTAEEKARLDDLLRPIERRLDVDDPAVLNNLNTPDAWEAWSRSIEQHD